MAQRDITNVTCRIDKHFTQVPAKFHDGCREQAVTLIVGF
jgi:hypothetical protein